MACSNAGSPKADVFKRGRFLHLRREREPHCDPIGANAIRRKQFVQSRKYLARIALHTRYGLAQKPTIDRPDLSIGVVESAFHEPARAAM